MTLEVESARGSRVESHFSDDLAEAVQVRGNAVKRPEPQTVSKALENLRAELESCSKHLMELEQNLEPVLAERKQGEANSELRISNQESACPLAESIYLETERIASLKGKVMRLNRRLGL